MKRLVALLVLFLVPAFAIAPANAAWYRAESNNFIVYMDAREANVRGLVERLERFDRVMRTMAGAGTDQSPAKLRVFVLSSQRSIRRIYGENSQNISGFYSGSARGAFAVVPERRIGYGTFASPAEQVLFHEYAHHFMLQYLPANYPAWYREGFAELYSSVRFLEDERVLVGSAVLSRSPDLALRPWVPIEAILSSAEVPTEMLYAEGWLLAHYAAFNREAGALLSAYLRAIQDGRSTAEAYRQTFGASEIDFDEVLREYMRGALPGVSFALRDLPQVTVEAYPIADADAEAALLFALRDERGLAAAREFLAENPDHAQGWAELARIQLETDDFPAALASAERALEIDPANVDAALFKARTLLFAALDEGEIDGPRLEEARRLILVANHADPTNPLALYSYYQSFPDIDERPDAALDTLTSAHILVPQEPEIRFALITEMMRERRYAEALALMPPLLEAAHGTADPNAIALMARLRSLSNDADGELREYDKADVE